MRKEEVDLQNECVRYAGEYTSEKFKDGRDIEKHIVVNCIANGYYIGYRWAERSRRPRPWMLLVETLLPFLKTPLPLSPERLVLRAIHASNFYIKKAGFNNLSFAEQQLIRACASMGFREGYRQAEEDFKNANSGLLTTKSAV